MTACTSNAPAASVLAQCPQGMGTATSDTTSLRAWHAIGESTSTTTAPRTTRQARGRDPPRPEHRRPRSACSRWALRLLSGRGQRPFKGGGCHRLQRQADEVVVEAGGGQLLARLAP